MEKIKKIFNVDMFQLMMVTLFVIITYGIYMPSGLFISNIDEFNIDYGQAVIIMLLCSLVFGIIVIAIGLILKKVKWIFYLYVDLIFGITLAGYVQGNFLNFNLPELNGQEVDWRMDSKSAILSICAWCIVIILPHILRNVWKKYQEKVVIYGSAILCAMQMVSLVVIVLGTSRTTNNDFVVSKENEFLLSSKNNVVVFIVDTLDAQWAEKYVIEDDKYEDVLNNFTYFNNVVGGGAPTILGMPMLFTGELYDPFKLSLDEYYKQAYGNSNLFSDLKENDYLVNIYTNSMYLNHADVSNIDNVVEGSYKIDNPRVFAQLLYKLTAFYAAPYQAKSEFMFYTGEFNSTITAQNSEVELYIGGDPQFYQDYLSSGITLTNQENVFVLYHLFGAHGPYTMDENAEKVENSTLEQQIDGTFKIISEYIYEMKQKGVYDNSTIIIAGDHGAVDLYQNPAVFIKRAGDVNEFTTNSMPLSFKQLRATFVSNFLKNYQEEYGEDMFSYIPENPDEYRYMTADSFLRLNVYPEEERSVEAYQKFLIGNPARDVGKIQDVYEKCVYKVGDTIYFYGENRTKGIEMSGFSNPETNYRWTDSNEAEIEILIEKTDKNIELSIDYLAFGEQMVKVYVNNNLVDSSLYSGTAIKTIYIPKEYISSEEITIRFEIPNAVSPLEKGIGTDSRRLGLSINSLRMNETDKEITILYLPEENNSEQYTYKYGDIIFLCGESITKGVEVEGFSFPENNYRWTQEQEVEIYIPVHKTEKALELVLDYVAFGTQTARIFINNQLVDESLYTGAGTKKIAVPNEYLMKKELRIRIELPDATSSPMDKGIGTDTRKLGISIKTIKLNETEKSSTNEDIPKL